MKVQFNDDRCASIQLGGTRFTELFYSNEIVLLRQKLDTTFTKNAYELLLTWYSKDTEFVKINFNNQADAAFFLVWSSDGIDL